MWYRFIGSDVHEYHHSAAVYARVRVLLDGGAGQRIVDQGFC